MKPPHEMTREEILAEVESYSRLRFMLAGWIVGKRRWRVFLRALFYSIGQDNIVRQMNEGIQMEKTIREFAGRPRR
jgi:hypothetical protein